MCHTWSTWVRVMVKKTTATRWTATKARTDHTNNLDNNNSRQNTRNKYLIDRLSKFTAHDCAKSVHPKVICWVQYGICIFPSVHPAMLVCHQPLMAPLQFCGESNNIMTSSVNRWLNDVEVWYRNWLMKKSSCINPDCPSITWQFWKQSLPETPWWAW